MEPYLLRRTYLYAQEPMFCAGLGHLSVVQELTRIMGRATSRGTREVYNAALHASAEQGHTQIVICLLQAGANPTSGRDYAIRKAATNGHLDTVAALLAAYQHIQSLGIGRAFYWATTNGHLDIVKYLYESGVRPYNNPIFAAVQNNHEEVVTYLESVGYKKEESIRLD